MSYASCGYHVAAPQAVRHATTIQDTREYVVEDRRTLPQRRWYAHWWCDAADATRWAMSAAYAMQTYHCWVMPPRAAIRLCAMFDASHAERMPMPRWAMMRCDDDVIAEMMSLWTWWRAMSCRCRIATICRQDTMPHMSCHASDATPRCDDAMMMMTRRWWWNTKIRDEWWWRDAFYVYVIRWDAMMTWARARCRYDARYWRVERWAMRRHLRVTMMLVYYAMMAWWARARLLTLSMPPDIWCRRRDDDKRENMMRYERDEDYTRWAMSDEFKTTDDDAATCRWWWERWCRVTGQRWWCWGDERADERDERQMRITRCYVIVTTPFYAPRHDAEMPTPCAETRVYVIYHTPRCYLLRDEDKEARCCHMSAMMRIIVDAERSDIEYESDERDDDAAIIMPRDCLLWGERCWEMPKSEFDYERNIMMKTLLALERYAMSRWWQRPRRRAHLFPRTMTPHTRLPTQHERATNMFYFEYVAFMRRWASASATRCSYAAKHAVLRCRRREEMLTTPSFTFSRDTSAHEMMPPLYLRASTQTHDMPAPRHATPRAHENMFNIIIPRRHAMPTTCHYMKHYYTTFTSYHAV